MPISSTVPEAGRPNDPSFSSSSDWRLWLVLTLLFTAALGLRIAYFDESRILAERQYRSALLARAAYLAEAKGSPNWRREVAQTSAQRMGLLEPPVIEFLTSRIWLITAAEQLWIPRLFSSAFWLTAGLCLFGLAKKLNGFEAALYTTAYFLFLPLGVAISSAFVPDPLMLALFAASLLYIKRYSDHPSSGHLLTASIVCSACILVKPLCLFAIVGSFMATQLQRRGLSGLISQHSFFFATLLTLPTLLYYVHGIYFADFLKGQAQASIIPELLLRPEYWKRWPLTALRANGTIPTILAVLGFALSRDRQFRALIIGSLAGYFAFCMVFTYHVRFAGYYHLQLALPIALALGPSVALLARQLRRRVRSKPIAWASLVAAALLVLTLTFRQTDRLVRSAGPIVEPEVARAIGRMTRHSTRIVYVSQYYGIPLEYFGEVSGWQWPRPPADSDRAQDGQGDELGSIEERLASLRSAVAAAATDFMPEYFVITDFVEFAYHPDLAEYLTKRCKQITKNPAYLIYATCDDAQTPGPRPRRCRRPPTPEPS